jgi:DNA-binding MarR family transcriptional regulator
VLEFDVERSIGCWVAQTSNALRRAMNDELAREGITFRQWEVLTWSVSGEALSQAELAERMGIEAQTLVGILARMERDGWLERSCCPNDRRKKRFRPTPQAEAVWSRMIDCCRRVRNRATEGMTEEDLAVFKRICEVIRQNLSPEPATVETDTVCPSMTDTAHM